MNSSVTIYNLTDIENSVLKQNALENRAFEVADHLLGPGEAMRLDKSKWEAVAPRYARLLKLGALCLDKLPSGYAEARQQKAYTPSEGGVAETHAAPEEEDR